jgi:excisionase family DNA binding protein
MTNYLHPVKKAAERLGISIWTLRKKAYEGDIASVKIGAKLLIPESEIQRLISDGWRPRRAVECLTPGSDDSYCHAGEGVAMSRPPWSYEQKNTFDSRNLEGAELIVGDVEGNGGDGVSGDVWAALAFAMTFWDQKAAGLNAEPVPSGAA